MPEEITPAMHYVCTIEEAEKFVAGHSRFWVSNCGCREGRDHPCARSRMDVCLMFSEEEVGSGTGVHEITPQEADSLMAMAREGTLVTRPFRDMETYTRTTGICFCCDDCCGYFLGGNETCDKGAFLESTDFDACTHCGACEPVCYFHARAMKDGSLTVDRDQCYGCGMCRKPCPVDCIEMVKR